jgi:deferrochelatase/peroxidase EfeB
LITRRIRVRIEQWDRDSKRDQDARIGRERVSGAPLGGVRELDAVDLDAEVDGRAVVPEDAHIRLASPVANGGARILRRSYSFSEGVDESGRLDAGMFFMCFQRDPRRQFVPVQQRLAAHDALNHYITHTGSAVFACPGGMAPGEWIGRNLFES